MKVEQEGRSGNRKWRWSVLRRAGCREHAVREQWEERDIEKER